MRQLILYLLFCFTTHLSAQEICDNGLDDDNNGLIDCVDPACICDVCANRQGNIWYFGDQAGLDFNNETPRVLYDSDMYTSEGSATIADANGQLLFYTDGVTVRNRNHQVMSNGTGLMGNTSSSQSVLIVPHPSDFALYYIFTVDAADLIGVADGLRYSIVDLSLDNGLGDVSTKNVLLMSETTEKIAAIKHCNNRDVWVVGHEWDSNNFYVFSITADGLNTTPDIQSIGLVHEGGSLGNGNMAGCMKFSIDGQRLACAIRDAATYELFDFDTYSGTLSNPMTLTDSAWGWTYGVEFSPDGNVFYGSTLLSNAEILQFDLTAGNTASVQASAYQVVTKLGLGNLQMGPDQRIYVATYNSQDLSFIENPNALGAACQYQDNAISLAPNSTILGLPTVLQSYNSTGFSVCPNGAEFDVCKGEVYLPDAFSPNGDGVNDYFRPTELNKRYIRSFKIYNRWGQEVYDNSSSEGWDGQFLGVPQPQGVYLYLLETHLPGQEATIRKGMLTLLR